MKKHELAHCRGQADIAPLFRDRGDQRGGVHVLGIGDGPQLVPELILEADAGTLPIDDDGAFADGGILRVGQRLVGWLVHLSSGSGIVLQKDYVKWNPERMCPWRHLGAYQICIYFMPKAIRHAFDKYYERIGNCPG